MRFSFNCFNHSAHLDLEPTLPAQIDAAAGAGYDFIGLDVPSVLAHEAAGLQPGAVLARLQERALPCYELVPLSLADGRRAAVSSLDTVSRLARAVQAQQVLTTVRCNVVPNLVDNFRMALERLHDIGVSVSVEFMPTSPLPSLEAAVRLLEAVDDERLGIVVDIWHFILSGSAWSTLTNLPTERIGFVQLDDARSDAMGTSTEDSLHHRLLPGEGVFPIRQFHDALVEKRFDGVVSVEVLSRPWRSRPIAAFAEETLSAARRTWAA